MRFLVVLLLVTGCSAPRASSAWIAHRGNSSAAPENTLASVRSALALSPPPDWIEIDVHRSADGELVVIHDSTLDRTTDRTGAVADLPWSEIRSASAGYAERFGDAHASERVPLLDEVLAEVEGTATGVMIEVKAGGIGGDIVRLLEARGEVRRHLVASFKPTVLVDASMTNASARTLYLTGRASPEEIELARRIGAELLGAGNGSLTRENIAVAHRKGLAVWAWTVNEASDAEALVEMGVDGVISDVVGDLRESAVTKAP
jgi:glycerophosphoryl diester phosphodiesterase